MNREAIEGRIAGSLIGWISPSSRVQAHYGRHDAPGELAGIHLATGQDKQASKFPSSFLHRTQPPHQNQPEKKNHFQSFLKLAIELLLLKPCPLLAFPEVFEPEYIRSCAYMLYESRGDCCCIAAKESAEDGEGQIPKLLDELEEADEVG